MNPHDLLVNMKQKRNTEINIQTIIEFLLDKVWQLLVFTSIRKNRYKMDKFKGFIYPFEIIEGK